MVELLVLEVVLGDLGPKRGERAGVGEQQPSSSFSSVDLPQPLAPSSATFSPRSHGERHVVERREAFEVRIADVLVARTCSTLLA